MDAFGVRAIHLRHECRSFPRKLVKNILIARQQTTLTQAIGDATSEAKQAQQAMFAASNSAIKASHALTEIANASTESLRKASLSASRHF